MSARTRSTVATLVGMVMVLVAGGCTAAPEPQAEGKAPTATEIAEVAPEPDPEPEPEPEPDNAYGSGEFSDRGNLIKTIGQLAGVTNQAGDSLADFTVTAIEPGFTCTGEYSDSAANGNYIAITFEVTTTSALAQESWPEFGFSAWDFKVIGPDGTRENDSVGNSFGCLAPDEELPTDIGPGERATGKIVLDSAHTTGFLVLDLGSTNGGWEWEF